MAVMPTATRKRQQALFARYDPNVSAEAFTGLLSLFGTRLLVHHLSGMSPAKLRPVAEARRVNGNKASAKTAGLVFIELLVPGRGLELPTFALRMRCSTN